MINFVITTLIHYRLVPMQQLLGAVISAIKVQIYIVSQFTLPNYETTLLSGNNWSGPTSGRLMAWCHCLNRRWPNINEARWHSAEENVLYITHYKVHENFHIWKYCNIFKGHWINSKRPLVDRHILLIYSGTGIAALTFMTNGLKGNDVQFIIHAMMNHR